MAKVLGIAAIVIVVVGAITQLVIPAVVEHRAVSSLEQDDNAGGHAEVSVSSFPAVRLLWGSGDRFEARGRGLTIDLDKRTDDPLGRLNGFDEVDIDFEDLTAGPVNVNTFSLVKKEEDTSFYLRMDAETTPLALGQAMGGQLGGELGQMIAGAAAGILPDGGTTNLPVAIEGQVSRADGGAVDVDSVRASVAGVPAGPFAEAMVQAVVERL